MDIDVNVVVSKYQQRLIALVHENVLLEAYKEILVKENQELSNRVRELEIKSDSELPEIKVP